MRYQKYSCDRHFQLEAISTINILKLKYFRKKMYNWKNYEIINHRSTESDIENKTSSGQNVNGLDGRGHF